MENKICSARHLTAVMDKRIGVQYVPPLSGLEAWRRQKVPPTFQFPEVTSANLFDGLVRRRPIFSCSSERWCRINLHALSLAFSYILLRVRLLRKNNEQYILWRVLLLYSR